MILEAESTIEDTEQETLVEEPEPADDDSGDSKTWQERINKLYDSARLPHTFLGTGMKLFTESLMMAVWFSVPGLVAYLLSHFGYLQFTTTQIIGAFSTVTLTMTAASWCSTSITGNSEDQ